MNRAARRAQGRHKAAAPSAGILSNNRMGGSTLGVGAANPRVPTWAPVRTVEAALAACQRFDWVEAERIARAVFEREPDNLTAAHLLVCTLTRIGRYEEALPLAEWLCEHDRGTDALTAWADVLYRVGHVEAALDLVSHRLRFEPTNRMLLQSAYHLHEHLGDYRAAHRYMHALYRVDLTMPEAVHRVDRPPWRGEYLGPDKRLLIFERSNAGHGDSLSHMRFVRMAKERSGAQTIYECLPSTARLAQSCSGADAVLPMRPRGTVGIEAEFAISTPMLPAVLDLALEDIPGEPYITADEAAVQEWRAKLPAEGLNVGICHHGERTHLADYMRSTKLEMWEPLRSIPGVNWFSLQFGEALPASWNPVGGIGTPADFSHTAAAVSACDLIVSVETSIAHLAGALGKEAWVVVPKPTDSRWERDGDTTHWYRSVKLYRQPKPRDWQSVFARVAADLRALSEHLPQPHGGGKDRAESRP